MSKIDLPQGTLDLLVLRVLTGGEMHGWGIAQRLTIISQDALQLQEGTLYPALYRMEQRRLNHSRPCQRIRLIFVYSAIDRRDRFHCIT